MTKDRIWTEPFTDDALITADLGVWYRQIVIDSDSGMVEANLTITKASTYGPLLLVIADESTQSTLAGLHEQTIEQGFLITVSYFGDPITLFHVEPFKTLIDGVDEMIIATAESQRTWPRFSDLQYRQVSRSALHREALNSMLSHEMVRHELSSDLSADGNKALPAEPLPQAV